MLIQTIATSIGREAPVNPCLVFSWLLVNLLLIVPYSPAEDVLWQPVKWWSDATVALEDGVSLVAIWLVYAFLTWWYPHLLYHVDLADGEKGWDKCFTFTLYLGSHTHIFKIKIFNQSSTFKSIELLDSSEKERVLTKSRELWGIPVTAVYYCIWKWCSSGSPLVLG